MLAALWQGELVAALGAVVEEVEFPDTCPRIKPAEVSSIKMQHGSEEVVFLKEPLERCLFGTLPSLLQQR
jgi:hypothetical protein